MSIITKGRLGELAYAAGIYRDRLQNSAVRTGELLGDRLVSVGMALWVGAGVPMLDVYAGAPDNADEMRELIAALEAAEALREPEHDEWPRAAGASLDQIASDHYGVGRNVGETDAELRARITRNWPGA